MPRLPEDVRAIAVDMHGHDGSADTPPSFRIEEMAADVAALMDHPGILRATVVGHSLGTLVAQPVAAEHPSHVDGLVLIGAIPTGALPLMSELRDIIADQADPIGTEFIREFQYSTLARPLPQPFMDRIIAESGRLSGTVWRASPTAAAVPTTASAWRRSGRPRSSSGALAMRCSGSRTSACSSTRYPDRGWSRTKASAMPSIGRRRNAPQQTSCSSSAA